MLSLKSCLIVAAFAQLGVAQRWFNAQIDSLRQRENATKRAWDDRCSWITNKDLKYDRVEFDQLKTWEECIFRRIIIDNSPSCADGDMVCYHYVVHYGITSKPGFIPLTNAYSREINVTIESFDLQRLILDELKHYQKFDVKLVLTWTDPRLAWDKDLYQLSKIRLHNAEDAYKLWFPRYSDLSRRPVFVPPSDEEDWDHSEGLIVIYFDGTVKLSIEFDHGSANEENNDINYENYPRDKSTLCERVAYRDSYPNRINHNYPKPHTKVDVQLSTYNVKSASIGPDGYETFKVCAVLIRSDFALELQLLAPFVIIGIIAILAPLCNRHKLQLQVSLLCICLLQFWMFAVSLTITDKARATMTLPLKLYRFLNIVILANFVITLVLLKILPFIDTLQLSHKIDRFIEKFNSMLTCSASNREKLVADEDPKAQQHEARIDEFVENVQYILFVCACVIGLVTYLT